MADKYLLESGTFGYQLEDGSGVLLLEFLDKSYTGTGGLTYGSNSVTSIEAHALETFTHANSAGSLTADKTWFSYLGGTGWGIVSNQAKIAGINSSFTDVMRMEVDADLTKLVTVTATLVSFAGGDASHFAQLGIYLQKDSSATDSRYAWVASRGASGDLWQLYRYTGGSAVQLGSTVVQAIVNGQTFGISWNPSDHAIKGYINGVEKISQVDSNFTANKRAGFDAASNDPACAIIVDNVNYSVIVNTFLYTGTGGLTYGGVATTSYTMGLLNAIYTGTGGLTYGGVATTLWQKLFAYLGSGGLSFGGVASTLFATSHAYLGSGGLTYGGTATTLFATSHAYVGSGGLDFAGTATTIWQRLFAYLSTGGITFAGDAVTLWQQLITYLGSGGLDFGGVALTLWTKVYVGTGGLVFGGVAATEGPGGATVALYWLYYDSD